jgi:hypothetical protein
MIIHSFVNKVSNLQNITSFVRLPRSCVVTIRHLVGVVGPGGLLALGPALFGNVVLAEHVTGLLHELTHGRVLLAVLFVVVVGGFVSISCTGGGATAVRVCGAAVGVAVAADACAGRGAAAEAGRLLRS